MAWRHLNICVIFVFSIWLLFRQILGQISFETMRSNWARDLNWVELWLHIPSSYGCVWRNISFRWSGIPTTHPLLYTCIPSICGWKKHFFVLFWPSYWTGVVQDGRRRRSSGSLAREKIPTSFGRLRRSESLPSPSFLFFLVFLLHPRRLISSFFTTDALLYRHTHTQRRHFSPIEIWAAAFNSIFHCKICITKSWMKTGN
jgi:hypothetical protein